MRVQGGGLRAEAWPGAVSALNFPGVITLASVQKILQVDVLQLPGAGLNLARRPAALLELAFAWRPSALYTTAWYMGTSLIRNSHPP